MTYTKENLENLRKDEFSQMVARMLNLDLNELINKIETEEVSDEKQCTKDENNKSESGSNGLNRYIMSKEQLDEFIKKYINLESSVKKLNYLYGIDICSKPDSLYTQYNELIWSFIRTIFGYDNSELIADYIFDNSVYNSVGELYAALN